MTTTTYPNEFKKQNITSALEGLKAIRDGEEVKSIWADFGGPNAVSKEEMEEEFRREWKTRWTAKPAQ